jgi:predicted Rossmann fold nucleotide-binding protein DprA/Smf involved in DNA uptake
MMPHRLSPDAQAILLICSSLGLPPPQAADVKPLSQDEWNELAGRIAESDLKRPGALLEYEADFVRRSLRLSDPLAERLRQLLRRGGQLAIEIERLSSLGIWVLTRADDLYPRRLKQVLGSKAPCVLFGAGDPTVMSREGLAIVGSRDVDEAGARFAEAAGRKCAEAGLTVISGAAKGVDRQGMSGALESGGTAVGVLADSLEKAIATREIRRLITEGRLVLVTPYHPQARFTVGTAMQRNKLIYSLARYALVVASAQENGGTWAGAVENLKAGWVPLFVRTGRGVPVGNLDLIGRGGLEFPDTLLTSLKDLKEWLEEHAGVVGRGYEASSGVREEQELYTPVVTTDRVTSLTASAIGGTDELTAIVSQCDLFPVVWPYIARMLSEPRTEKYLAGHLSLEVKQVKAWLTRALKERLIRKKTRPVRYELVELKQATPQGQGSLFNLNDS